MRNVRLSLTKKHAAQNTNAEESFPHVLCDGEENESPRMICPPRIQRLMIKLMNILLGKEILANLFVVHRQKCPR